MSEFKIGLKKDERGILVGETGSGKSELARAIIYNYLQQYHNARVLIIDTKPNFQADYELSGLSAKKHYKNWEKDTPISGSVLLPIDSRVKQSLKYAYALGFTIVLSQTESLDAIPLQNYVVQEFFSMANKNTPQLVVVDEGLDFWNSHNYGKDDAILKTVRAGRKKGVACLIGMQRPKNVPLQLETETTKFYIFRLAYDADKKRLFEMGIPEGVELPEKKYIFYYYSKVTKSGGLKTLKLP